MWLWFGCLVWLFGLCCCLVFAGLGVCGLRFAVRGACCLLACVVWCFVLYVAVVEL